MEQKEIVVKAYIKLIKSGKYAISLGIQKSLKFPHFQRTRTGLKPTIYFPIKIILPVNAFEISEKAIELKVSEEVIKSATVEVEKNV